jgi:hypothetical protein
VDDDAVWWLLCTLCTLSSKISGRLSERSAKWIFLACSGTVTILRLGSRRRRTTGSAAFVLGRGLL